MMRLEQNGAAAVVQNDVDLMVEDGNITHCIDVINVFDGVSQNPLSDEVKTVLNELADIKPKDEEEAIYLKKQTLKKLCNVIVEGRRFLSEDEKEYLFGFISAALEEGGNAVDLGLNDAVLARLVAENNDENNKTETQILRTQKIAELAYELEETDGFYEATAAKLLAFEPQKANVLTARFSELIAKGRRPQGVIYASALLEQNQIKLAIGVLVELAKRGQALEMIGYLHRLLPKLKGAEKYVADILRTNLQNIDKNNPLYAEYAARRTLLAVRLFVESGAYKEAAVLLHHLTLGGWLVGNGELETQFMRVANQILCHDKSLTTAVAQICNKLNLRVYSVNGVAVVGRVGESPIKAIERRKQENAWGVAVFEPELHHDVKKDYDALYVLGAFGGEVLAKIDDLPEIKIKKPQPSQTPKSVAQPQPKPVQPQAKPVQGQNQGQKFKQVQGQGAKVVSSPQPQKAEPQKPMQMPKAQQLKQPQKPTVSPQIKPVQPQAKPVAATPMGQSQPKPQSKAKSYLPVEKPMLDVHNVDSPLLNVVDDDISIDAFLDDVVAPKGKKRVKKAPFLGNKKPQSKNDSIPFELPEIENWDMSLEEELDIRANSKSSKKININNILKINSDEVDKHFEKIKKVTSAAIRRAEVQAAAIKQRVEDSDITNSPSVERIKKIAKSESVNKIKDAAKKMSIFRKKK